MAYSMDTIDNLFYQSVGLLSTFAYLTGFVVCLIQRRLSEKLLLAAIGFLGLFTSCLIARPSAHGFSTSPDGMFLGYLIASILDVLSNLFLVGGLWLTLVEIRRKVTLAMERVHG